MKELYDILQISEGSSQDEIKEAYKKLCRKYHPTKVKQSEKEKSEKFMMEINKAYEALTNKEKLRSYRNDTVLRKKNKDIETKKRTKNIGTFIIRKKKKVEKEKKDGEKEEKEKEKNVYEFESGKIVYNVLNKKVARLSHKEGKGYRVNYVGGGTEVLNFTDFIKRESIRIDDRKCRGNKKRAILKEYNLATLKYKVLCDSAEYILRKTCVVFRPGTVVKYSPNPFRADEKDKYERYSEKGRIKSFDVVARTYLIEKSNKDQVTISSIDILP